MKAVSLRKVHDSDVFTSIGERMAIRTAIQDGDVPRAIEKVLIPTLHAAFRPIH